jgi:hypothetical protein
VENGFNIAAEAGSLHGLGKEDLFEKGVIHLLAKLSKAHLTVEQGVDDGLQAVFDFFQFG